MPCLEITSILKSWVCSINVTNTLCAVPDQSVTKVTRLAAFTTEASSVKHASEAPPSQPVTVANVRWVDVVIARARLAATAWDEWVPKVTVVAFFALSSSVAFFTGVTD